MSLKGQKTRSDLGEKHGGFKNGEKVHMGG